MNDLINMFKISFSDVGLFINKSKRKISDLLPDLGARALTLRQRNLGFLDYTNYLSLLLYLRPRPWPESGPDNEGDKKQEIFITSEASYAQKPQEV